MSLLTVPIAIPPRDNPSGASRVPPHIPKRYDDGVDPLWRQIVELFVLAIPIACIARTVVFEEVFREAREFCKHRSQNCRRLLERKFFYLFTCEYCFSHYVTAFFLVVTRYKLLFDDWRGYLIGFFALVFVANSYLNLYARLRVDITSEKKAIEVKEAEVRAKDKEAEAHDREIRKMDAEMSNGSNDDAAAL